MVAVSVGADTRTTIPRRATQSTLNRLSLGDFIIRSARLATSLTRSPRRTFIASMPWAKDLRASHAVMADIMRDVVSRIFSSSREMVSSCRDIVSFGTRTNLQRLRRKMRGMGMA
jgi:hypothetical protein